nr:hypothetical protein GCM10025732_45170 [Glycomyces mayteni]
MDIAFLPLQWLAPIQGGARPADGEARPARAATVISLAAEVAPYQAERRRLSGRDRSGPAAT